MSRSLGGRNKANENNEGRENNPPLPEVVQANIRQDFEALIKKHGGSNVRLFARKLLAQVAMEERMRR